MSRARLDPDDLRKRLVGVESELSAIEDEADETGRILLAQACANARRFVGNGIRADIDLGWRTKRSTP